MDWEARLEQRAIRENWPVPPKLRVMALQRIADLLDPDHEHPIGPPTHAQVIATIRTLIVADKHNLELRKYDDSHREAEVTVADAVRAMQAEGDACDREREREPGDAGPGGDPPLPA